MMPRSVGNSAARQALKRAEAIQCLRELEQELTEEAIAEIIGYGEEFDRLLGTNRPDEFTGRLVN